MTAEQWEACRDPGPMLAALRGRSGERKLRLFGCALARTRWDDWGEQDRKFIELAERNVDGQASNQAFAAAHAELDGLQACCPYELNCVAESANLYFVLLEDPLGWRTAPPPWRDHNDRWFVALSDRLRCIFGNPFCREFSVSPGILAHNDGVAVKLATVIYEECDPSTGLLDAARLAIFADALEDAGVDDRSALEHLRGPGPHCRGCHVVDAILGRS